MASGAMPDFGALSDNWKVLPILLRYDMLFAELLIIYCLSVSDWRRAVDVSPVILVIRQKILQYAGLLF